jgi:hypothetical protein
MPRFGILAAAAVTAALAQNAAAADAKKDAKDKAAAPAAPAATTAKCVHNCAGYAACKGADKGKNSCAGEGLVPKECSSQTTEDACRKVVDAKKNGMCTWI